MSNPISTLNFVNRSRPDNCVCLYYDGSAMNCPVHHPVEPAAVAPTMMLAEAKLIVANDKIRELEAELEKARTNVRHWQQECGKLNGWKIAYPEVWANFNKQKERIKKLEDANAEAADALRQARNETGEAIANGCKGMGEMSDVEAACRRAINDRTGIRDDGDLLGMVTALIDDRNELVAWKESIRP